jgi:hypothetical protein
MTCPDCARDCKHAPGKGCCPCSNPAPMCFEEDVCALDIGGLGQAECPEFEISQGTYPGTDGEPSPNPTTIIRSNQEFTVRMRWQANGAAVRLITGSWEYAVHFHRVDAAGGPVTKTGTLPMNTGNNTFAVDVGFTFAAGELPDGVYKIYVTAGFSIPGPAWAAIAGFGEGCVVRVFTPA